MTTLYRALVHLVILGACSVIITGCTSTKDDIIPNDGVPIEDVYYGHVEPQSVKRKTEPTESNPPKSSAGKEHWVVKRPANANELDKNPYVLRNTLSPVFRKLDNPTLYIFSFPYLSDNGRVPVPAYITEMKMFEREEYALPGEVNLNMGGNNAN